MSRAGATHKQIERVDGRTVLFLTVCSCLVSFLTTDLLAHAIFTFCLLLILCFFGLVKQGICCFLVYLTAIFGLYTEIKYGISFPSPLLLSIIYKLILPAMPVYLLFRIPSGKLTASLRKLPLPTKAMLVLVVMLRFAPTVVHEFGEVKEAMRVRGFLRSFGTVLRHPLNTLEYAIVPMVFRSLKIADELSASAIVRGIESPCDKQSYYVSRINLLDTFLMLFSAAALICCIML
ncbi:energy-coupling factor transporter transmembrane component T [Desulfoscipio sp. XC116]|uniref:energy-coupling factor transporter transmembrane component T family protein n=1 Tax=Desulfoscipio sp. XC116 TaxID=3144975 RepID=UPI00325B3818